MAEIANQNIDIAVVETGGENAQYFWHNLVDSGAGEGAGAHITEMPKDDFIADPENGGANALIDSDGLKIRDGITDLAVFTANGAVVGLSSEGNVELTSSGLTINNGNIQLSSFDNNGVKLNTTEGNEAFSIDTSSTTKEETIPRIIDSALYFESDTVQGYSTGGSQQRYAPGNKAILLRADDNYTTTNRPPYTFVFGWSTTSEEDAKLAQSTFTLTKNDILAFGGSPHWEEVTTKVPATNRVIHLNFEFVKYTTNVWYLRDIVILYENNAASSYTFPNVYFYLKSINKTADVKVPQTTISGDMVWKNPSDVFVVTQETTPAFNVAATGYTSGTLTVQKTGYYPVGVIGHQTNGSGSSFVSIVHEWFSSRTVGSGDVEWAVRGTRSTAISGMTLKFDILWVKAE